MSFPSIAEALAYLRQPVNQEEIQRRCRLVAEIHRLREEVGPIDLTMDDLLAEEDEEER